MNVYIGIDPSINSTGMTIRSSEGFVRFFIIKENKLTKKEKAAQTTNIDIFEYCQYIKEEVNHAKTSYERELYKAHNLSTIADTIYNIIDRVLYEMKKESTVENIVICMEGISYGSIRSSAVMDLAGLNYLIRDRLHHHTIVTDMLFVTPPAEIKKDFTGSGNANKDLMVATFKGSFPDFDLPKIDDIADSYAQSLYAEHLFQNMKK